MWRNFQSLRRLLLASLHSVVKLNNKTMLKKRQSNLWELKIVFNVRDVSAIFHFATLKLKQKGKFFCENAKRTHSNVDWERTPHISCLGGCENTFNFLSRPKWHKHAFAPSISHPQFEQQLRACGLYGAVCICVVCDDFKFSVVRMNHTLRLKHTTVERFTRHVCLIRTCSDTQIIKHQTTDIDPVWKLCSKQSHTVIRSQNRGAL